MKMLPLFFVALLLISCKKKEDTRTVESTTQLSTTTGANPIPPPANFNGLCSEQKVYSVLGGYTYSSATAQNFAAFTNGTFNNFNFSPTTCLNAGTVTLNGKTLKNLSNNYSDTTSSVCSDPFIWTGTGSVIPAFSFTNATAFSTYAGYTSWPDTIHKISGFSVTLTALQRADEARLIISSNAFNYVLTYTAMVQSGAIDVAANTLNSLPTSTSAVIQCDFYKNNLQVIGTQTVNFRNVTTFVKTVEVRN